MKKIDDDFLQDILSEYSSRLPSDSSPYKDMTLIFANQSLQLFKLAYNKLVDENYLEK